MNILLIFTDQPITSRLKYILHWVFEEQLQISFELTNDMEYWQKYSGAKINYSNQFIENQILQIKPADLLFEVSHIKEQNLSIQRWKKTTVPFYNQPGSKIPFDIFAAAFYHISRYEEYLPHEKDKHGRFKVEQSFADQFEFLDQAVVDVWMVHFRKLLRQLFELSIPKASFHNQHTFDIDMVWKYKNKTSKKLYGGCVKDFLKGKWKNIAERIQVIAGKKEDPYFCFNHLNQLHQRFKIKPIHFVLVGKNQGFDPNTPGTHREMQQFMKELSKNYHVEIHPSYRSNSDSEILEEEINLLSSCIQKKIFQSRQHFIKFSLPATYQNLIKAGIREDFSMGYASKNGFRASTSKSFLWYDLSLEEITDLRIHPFAFMDATNKFYLKQNAEKTFHEWIRIYNHIKNINGTMISIWHNYILGDHSHWMNLYERALEQSYGMSKKDKIS